MAPTPEQQPRTAAQTAFVNGGLRMHLIEFISLVTLAGGIKTFAGDIVPIPRGKASPANFAGAQGQGLAPNSKQQDTAWLALQHQVSREGLLPYVKAQFGLPPLLSLRQEYLQLPAPPANRSGIIESLAGLRPLPKVPVMSELSPIYSAELDAVFRGRRRRVTRRPRWTVRYRRAWGRPRCPGDSARSGPGHPAARRPLLSALRCGILRSFIAR